VNKTKAERQAWWASLSPEQQATQIAEWQERKRAHQPTQPALTRTEVIDLVACPSCHAAAGQSCRRLRADRRSQRLPRVLKRYRQPWPTAPRLLSHQCYNGCSAGPGLPSQLGYRPQPRKGGLWIPVAYAHITHLQSCRLHDNKEAGPRYRAGDRSASTGRTGAGTGEAAGHDHCINGHGAEFTRNRLRAIRCEHL